MIRLVGLTVLCGVATGAGIGFLACAELAEYALERIAQELYS